MAKSKKKIKQKAAPQKTASKESEEKRFDPLSAFNPVSEAKESLSTTLKLLISALTLVSALAWNDAIKAIFEYVRQILPQSTGEMAQIIGQVMYALVVTLITVFAIGRLKKIKDSFDKESES